VPYASRVIVKLLVLVALAFSLGDLRDATQITDEVSLLEAEPDAEPESIVVDSSITRAIPRQVALHENLVAPPRSLDAGRVFRPPRMWVA
jgi:hypothetical protein